MHPTGRSLAEANLRAALSLFPKCSPGAVLQEGDGVLLVASKARVTGAFHAAAVRTVRSVPADRVLAATFEFARSHGREVSVWAAEDADADLVDTLIRAELLERPPVVGMSLALPADHLAQVARRCGVDVQPVSTAEGVAAFADVHGRGITALGRPRSAVDHYATLGALTDPHADAFVASVDGVTVAASMTFTTGSAAGIYWVVTHPDRRRRGLGRAVTAAAAQAGAARGADLIVLQATAMGAPLYAELGFVPFTTYRRWLVTPNT